MHEYLWELRKFKTMWLCRDSHTLKARLSDFSARKETYKERGKLSVDGYRSSTTIMVNVDLTLSSLRMRHVTISLSLSMVSALTLATISYAVFCLKKTITRGHVCRRL